AYLFVNAKYRGVAAWRAASAPSGPVRAGQVLRAAHFDQTRGGALEGAGQALACIQRRRLGGGGAHQVDVAVVKFVHQVDEAACGIVAQAVEYRDAAQQQGVEFAPDLDVVARSTRSLAQGIEIEPGHARAARTHGDPAPFQHDAA